MVAHDIKVIRAQTYRVDGFGHVADLSIESSEGTIRGRTTWAEMVCHLVVADVVCVHRRHSAKDIEPDAQGSQLAKEYMRKGSGQGKDSLRRHIPAPQSPNSLLV